VSRGDVTTMQSLVDHALAHRPHPQPDMLRHALELAVLAEPEGVARASRMATLARAILEIVPGEAWAELALARALAQMGDVRAATDRLLHLELDARGTLAAAEAQRARLALSNPAAATEVDAVVRAADHAPVDALEAVAQRARRLAAAHAVWTAYLAAGIAERRRNRPLAARADLLLGLQAAPGASPIYAELARVSVAMGKPDEALEHAARARSLEGDSPRTIVASIEALVAAGRPEEARALHERGKALFPNDASVLAAWRPAVVAKQGLFARFFKKKT
jgi:tetratricopeptide (TPR) repeat protein